MRVKLPRRFKSVGHTITVSEVPLDNLHGETTVDPADGKSSGTIRIDSGERGFQRQETFWHEVLHVIDSRTRSRLSEPTIGRLAAALTEVIEQLESEHAGN